MTFAVGQRVRTRLSARPGYARGRAGIVHMRRSGEVYSVRFRACDLWGEDAGDHDVILELWETDLERA